MYSVIDLGEWVHPYDVSNRGVVCGMFYDKTTFRAFVWTAATGLTAIATDAWTSTAYAINDAGQVAGVLVREPDSPPRAFRWTPPGTLELLATPPLSEQSVALAIATDGRCAGMAEPVGEFFTDHRAVLWPNPGSSISVPLQEAHGMNDYGQIVGMSPATAPSGIFWYPKTPPALWQPDAPGATSGTAHALALPPNDIGGVAQAINAIGQVAGTSWGLGSDIRAFVWTPDTPNAVTGSTTSLGLLPSQGGIGNYSHAYGINRRGTVVGTSTGRAFIYRRGMMEDLNDFIASDSGWVLVEANAIDDRGRIVGRGGRYGQPTYRGFLLKPMIPWDELTKFHKPFWNVWLRQGAPTPPPEQEAARMDHPVQPLSSGAHGRDRRPGHKRGRKDARRRRR